MGGSEVESMGVVSKEHGGGMEYCEVERGAATKSAAAIGGTYI